MVHADVSDGGVADSVNGMRIGFVWPAELIQVLLSIRRPGADFAKIRFVSGDMDPAREPVQRTLLLALRPNAQLVVASWNIVQVKFTLRASESIVRRRECDNDRAHLGVNIAEDIGDPLAREHYTARRARFIQPEVEAPSIEKRKDVVKERICIWKCNAAPYRNNQ